MDPLTGIELATLGALAAAQLVAFRTLQWLVPSTYFRTADLVESQGDVTPKAVLIRLSLPMAAGAFGSWMNADPRVLAASGFLAWFLIAWPAFWLPRFVRGAHQPLTWLLMLAFLISWTLLPLAGATLFEAISAGEKDNLLVQGLLLPVCTTAVTGILAAADRPFLAERDRLQLAELHRDADGISGHTYDDSYVDDGTIAAPTTIADAVDRNAIGVTAVLVLGALVGWIGRRR